MPIWWYAGKAVFLQAKKTGKIEGGSGLQNRTGMVGGGEQGIGRTVLDVRKFSKRRSHGLRRCLVVSRSAFAWSIYMHFWEDDRVFFGGVSLAKAPVREMQSTHEADTGRDR